MIKRALAALALAIAALSAWAAPPIWKVGVTWDGPKAVAVTGKTPAATITISPNMLSSPYDGSGNLRLPYANLDVTQIENAQTGPTVTATGSGVLTGDYWYSVIYVDAAGHHTALWAISSKVSPSSQQVQLTNIPTGPTGTVARQIYRTTVAEAQGYHNEYERLLTTINDNTTTSYLDNTPDSSIASNAQVPLVNTTGGQWNLNGSPYITVGDSSIALGKGAGYGQNDVSIGYQAGGAGNWGYNHQNVNIGSLAGYASRSGAGNVNIGSGAGRSNQTAHDNVYIGLNAGYWNLGGGNVFIGPGAGQGTGEHTSNNAFEISSLGNDLMVGSFDPANKYLYVYGRFGVFNGDASIGGTLTCGALTVNNVPWNPDLFARKDQDQSWATTQTFLGGVLVGGQAASDVPPLDTVISGQAAYPQAITNIVGGKLILSGGQGQQSLTVTDYSVLYGSALVFYLNHNLPTAETYQLTEGVQFAAQTDNATTAANIAAAINAWIPGLHATSSGAVVSYTETPNTVTVAVVPIPSAGVTYANASPGPGYLANAWYSTGSFEFDGDAGYAWPAIPWTPGPGQTTIDAYGTSFRDVGAATGFAVAGIDGGTPGKILLLTFEQPGVTITDGGTTGWCNLNGNFSSTAGCTLQLLYTGTQWREISRSMN